MFLRWYLMGHCQRALVPPLRSWLVLLSLFGSVAVAENIMTIDEHGGVSRGLSTHADPDTYLRDIVALLQAEWPDNQGVCVVFHGHSVPAGYFRTPEIRPFDSYPHLTHRLVQQRYPTSMTEFIRTAIGGEHSEAGASRFSNDVLSLQPNVICIDYALNDRTIGLERAKRAWVRMIEAALRTNAKVILFTPTADLAANESSPDQSLLQHAQQIRGLADRFEIGLVDSFAAFQQYEDEHGSMHLLMSQSNHPNRLGHSIVAELLAEWFIPARGADTGVGQP